MDHLIARFTSGALLHDSEIRQLAQRATELGSYDIYGRIIDIGKNRQFQYRPVIEELAKQRVDPWLSRAALQVMWTLWDERERYSDLIKMHLEGADWDVDRDCQLLAITAAGEFAVNTGDLTILRRLLQMLDDEGEESLFREAAYGAIARAVGTPMPEVIALTEAFPHRVDRAIVNRARTMAGMR